MTDNLIVWNVRNWITVVLMFLLGWLVVMTIGSFVMRKQGKPTQEGVSLGYTTVA